MVTTDMLQSGHNMSWKHFVTIETTSGDTLSPQNNASRKWLQQICYSLGIICPGNILSHQRSLMEIPCLLKTMPLGNGQNKKQTQLPGVFPLPGLFVWYFKNFVTASLSLVQEHIWVMKNPQIHANGMIVWTKYILNQLLRNLVLQCCSTWLYTRSFDLGVPAAF